MDLMIFFAIALSGLFIVASVFQVALEVSRLNAILQARWGLEVVKIQKDVKYKKKADRFDADV